MFISCYIYPMTIEQTVEIPANHRLTIEVPREIPAGRTQVVIQFPVQDEAYPVVPPDEKGQMSSPAFREALRRSYGAWKDNPWKNCIEDINAMRDDWEERV
jgi:hypothetical protein